MEIQISTQLQVFAQSILLGLCTVIFQLKFWEYLICCFKILFLFFCRKGANPLYISGRILKFFPLCQNFLLCKAPECHIIDNSRTKFRCPYFSHILGINLISQYFFPWGKLKPIVFRNAQLG